jgi:hypothetical protein
MLPGHKKSATSARTWRRQIRHSSFHSLLFFAKQRRNTLSSLVYRIRAPHD